MTSITISEELESELKKIRRGQRRLRERDLDGVVAFLVDDYLSRRTVEQQLHIFRQEMASTVKKSAEEGVIESMSVLLANITYL